MLKIKDADGRTKFVLDDEDEEPQGVKCPKSGQIDLGQQGEYPCEACGLPTVWDKDYEEKN